MSHAISGDILLRAGAVGVWRPTVLHIHESRQSTRLQAARTESTFGRATIHGEPAHSVHQAASTVRHRSDRQGLHTLMRMPRVLALVSPVTTRFWKICTPMVSTNQATLLVCAIPASFQIPTSAFPKVSRGNPVLTA